MKYEKTINAVRDEILQLINMLSETPVEQIKVLMLDDSYFKVKLIIITAKLRINETGNSLFEKMQNLSDTLYDASSFCSSIVKPVTDTPPQQHSIKVMQDIIYMENVIFFYANGEMDFLLEKLTGSEYREQKEDCLMIKNKINEYRKIAAYAERDENDILIFKGIAENLNEIVTDLNHVSDKLGTQGGAIKLIADELGRLVDKTRQIIIEIEGLQN